MIQIPRYEPQVAEQAIPTPQVGANLPDAAFGGGAGLSRVAEEANAYKREQLILAEQEADRQAEIRASSFRRDMNQWEQDNVYNKDTGAESRRGANANGVYNDLNIGFNEWADKYSKGLTNDRQRRDFQALRDARWSHIGTWANRHEAREGEVWEASEYDKNQESSKARAARDASTTDTEAGEMVVNAEKRAGKFGVSPDREIKSQLTDLHRRVIAAQLANGNPEDADRHFTKYEHQIDDKVGSTIKADLRTGRVAKQARLEVEKIFTHVSGSYKDEDGVGVYGEDTPAAQTLAEARARIKDIKDEDVRIEAERVLPHRWREVKEERDAAYNVKKELAFKISQEQGWAAVPPDLKRDLMADDVKAAKKLEGGYAEVDDRVALTELMEYAQSGKLKKMTASDVMAEFGTRLTDTTYRVTALHAWEAAQKNDGGKALKLLTSNDERILRAVQQLGLGGIKKTDTYESIAKDEVKNAALWKFRDDYERRNLIKSKGQTVELKPTDENASIEETKAWAMQNLQVEDVSVYRTGAGGVTHKMQPKAILTLTDDEKDTVRFKVDPDVRNSIMGTARSANMVRGGTMDADWIAANRGKFNRAMIARLEAIERGEDPTIAVLAELRK